MPNQTETLARLNKEKEYEDKLAADLTDFFIVSLDNIPDIDDKEKEIIRKNLDIISTDSRRHSQMFNNLIQMVLENGEDNY